MVNLLVAGALLVYADWQAPLHDPTRCDSGNPGCDAPVNVGPSTQFKSGALGVRGIFQTESTAYFLGNVGIGTTSTLQRLTVKGSDAKILVSGTKAGAIQLQDLRTASRPWFEWQAYRGKLRLNSGWDPLGLKADIISIIPTTGYVGIGTTNPQSALHVGSNYIQIPYRTAERAPNADCDEASEEGRMYVLRSATPQGSLTIQVVVCFGSLGWRDINASLF